MPTIFISYRVKDSLDIVPEIYEFLADEFKKEFVFWDKKGLHAGRSWSNDLKKALKAANIILVVIRKDWLTVEDKKGNPRLFDKNDWVRREVREGLQGFQKGSKNVIPLLIDVPPLDKSKLPEDLHELANLQAIKVNWNHDRDQLKAQIIQEIKANFANPIHNKTLIELRDKARLFDDKDIKANRDKDITDAQYEKYMELYYKTQLRKNIRGWVIVFLAVGVSVGVLQNGPSVLAALILAVLWTIACFFVDRPKKKSQLTVRDTVDCLTINPRKKHNGVVIGKVLLDPHKSGVWDKVAAAVEAEEKDKDSVSAQDTFFRVYYFKRWRKHYSLSIAPEIKGSKPFDARLVKSVVKD